MMGFVEPLKHLPELLRLRRSLIARWRTTPPDVFVGIDSPDFNLGLETALKASGIKTMHYVSPSIWAWRAGRLRKILRAADCVLCLLPFEPALYEKTDTNAVFVGHPKAGILSPDIDVASIRSSLNLSGEGKVVAVLPGSRGTEVSRLAPIFAAAAARIAANDDRIRFITPVARPKLRTVISDHLEQQGVTERFTLVDGNSIEAMSAADVVLLASGTAALESALLGKPTIAAYRVASLTYWILRFFNVIKLQYFTLPNLLTEKPQIPEFIQYDAKPDVIANEVISMLDDPQRCAGIRRRFAKLRGELALDADERAADALIRLAAQG